MYNKCIINYDEDNIFRNSLIKIYGMGYLRGE